MSVYVDDMRAIYGRMFMCHMIADSHEELVTMARSIGVAEKWLQWRGTHREHFDVCLSKRVLAVRAGAVELTQRELVRKIVERKK